MATLGSYLNLIASLLFEFVFNDQVFEPFGVRCGSTNWTMISPNSCIADR
jgi:hypothetical protein